jgi:hypothetical protein
LHELQDAVEIIREVESRDHCPAAQKGSEPRLATSAE